MSKETGTLSRVVPSACPTVAELAEWQTLPHNEQVKRLAEGVDQGFKSTVASNDIDQIIAEARAELKV